ncbi:hypothetical protein ACFXNW_18320 [Nocardia sp. NPDC059180]|uniref:hypothetical protein n=1 Tax=Nocardia sp. NPDC059180 TaxID=3346761 RepID=UPI0036CD107E
MRNVRYHMTIEEFVLSQIRYDASAAIGTGGIAEPSPQMCAVAAQQSLFAMAQHLRGIPGDSMMTCLANLWADRAGFQSEWTL